MVLLLIEVMGWADHKECNAENSYEDSDITQLKQKLQTSKTREAENERKLAFLQVHCQQLVEKMEKMRTKRRDLEEELIKAALVVYQMERHIQSQRRAPWSYET